MRSAGRSIHVTWDLRISSRLHGPQAALQCPSSERLVSSYVEPLSVDRFLSNIWHAPANTRLRIAYVPEDAYRAGMSGAQTFPAAWPTSGRDLSSRWNFPAVSTQGDVVVVNDCAASYMATGSTPYPWVPIDAATFRVTVRFDAADTTPRTCGVWILRPYGEATGRGVGGDRWSWCYRLRLDIDWFPPVLQDWTPYSGRRVVAVQLGPDLTTREWLLMARRTCRRRGADDVRQRGGDGDHPRGGGAELVRLARSGSTTHFQQISAVCSAFAEAE